MLIVYFSSKSENTHRFVQKISLPSKRIPIQGDLKIDEPYILIVPSYGGGEIKGCVPKQIVDFLNKEDNRSQIKGVIGSGNTNFGDMFCFGAKVVAQKCNVPLLYTFELMGNQRDVNNIENGVLNFGKN